MLRVIVWHSHTRSPIKTARILLLSIPESFKLSIREWQKLAPDVLCIDGNHIRFKQTRIDTAFESRIDEWPDPHTQLKIAKMIFGIIFMWMRIVHSQIQSHLFIGRILCDMDKVVSNTFALFSRWKGEGIRHLSIGGFTRTKKVERHNQMPNFAWNCFCSFSTPKWK